MVPFLPHQLYKRSLIHDEFGGNRQGGISPSAKVPYIFIFSGKSGAQYGYEDGWDNHNIFSYTGEGQEGDMQFIKGNLALKDHINSENPTVLISPSMMEGVDLSDNLSRFQIICKVPFPYLGDEVVKKRLEKNETWYSYATAKSLIQSLGRSIRNENDFAISYILDSDWTNFFNKNKRMFEGHIGKVI